MALTLLLARHGQTDLNIDERWQGRLDPPLNATGRQQAAALLQALPPHLDAIWCSPMQRARQTAQPVADARGLAIRYDTRWRERDFGVFDGLSLAEATAQFPALVAGNAAYRWDTEPPGAEPTRAVVDRVAEGLAALRAAHGDGQTVLLVCHGFVLRCLRALIDGVPEADFFTEPRIANGAVLTRQLP